MTNKLTWFALLGLTIVQIATLSACGSGVASIGGDELPAPIALSFSEINSIRAPIRLAISRVSATQGETLEMQTAGAAEYSGFAAFNRESVADTLALASLSVDFSNGTAQGELTNFTDRSGTEYIGAVAISTGVIVGNNLTVNLAGTLQTDSPVLGNITLSGTVSPQFLGVGGNYLRGDTINQWTFRNGTDAVYSQDVGGEIALVR